MMTLVGVSTVMLAWEPWTDRINLDGREEFGVSVEVSTVMSLLLAWKPWTDRINLVDREEFGVSAEVSTMMSLVLC